MNKLPFSLSNDSLTVFVNGLPYTFHSATVQYNQISDAIHRKDWDAIPGLLLPGGALAKYLGEKFAYADEKISYDGVPLPSGLMVRITAMANEGMDPSPLLRFYERLHKNPSWRSREQVFSFLQHLNISIEPDGTFLAYKGIREDYTDQYTGTIPNNPGQVHKMARNLISDDADTACHFGFHVGALSYATGFGPVTVICRVDPEHVVCVPKDYSAQKMRVCEYEVIGEWSGEAMPVNADAEDLPARDYEEDDYEGNGTMGTEDDDAWPEEVLKGGGDALTRRDLTPGTVYYYTRTRGNPFNNLDTWAVGNVVLPGAPKANCEEACPSLDAAVTVIWQPTMQEAYAATTAVPTGHCVDVGELVPEVVIKKVKAPRLDKLGTKDLMGCSIEELRRYASGRLKIVGASKIPGGKSALVSRIMKVRKRLSR